MDEGKLGLDHRSQNVEKYNTSEGVEYKYEWDVFLRFQNTEIWKIRDEADHVLITFQMFRNWRKISDKCLN